MSGITRRTLIASALSVPASSLLARSGWARTIAQPEDEVARAAFADSKGNSLREQLLFDFGWKFTFGHGTDPSKDLGFGYGQADFAKTGDFTFAKIGFDDAQWRTLDLPHDWAVELPFVHDDSGTGDSQLRSHGYKPLGRRYPETSVGWYRREFEVPASDAGRRIWVEFDGVFRDALVFVNGCFIGRNNNGYAAIRFDLSDFLSYGAKNCIAVRVDASFGDGWFYEGAGIYRHVWLSKTGPIHLGRWDTTIRSAISGNAATLSLATTVQNESKLKADCNVSWKILDGSGVTVATAESPRQIIDPGAFSNYSASTIHENPALWSVDQPNLYSLVVTVDADGAVRDEERVTFGIRTAVFDADKGFSLNGESLKIQGTCNHQDHAGIGTALPNRMQWYRLGVLREMGCNAVRTSHNPPTPEWVEACDRMGMMMMCETRQMSSSLEGMQQLEQMIKRYRNSPSVIIWSIGNEENSLQGKMAEQGARIADTMVALCHGLDPTRPVTAAVNADNEKGVSDAVDVIGFNYHREFPDNFHKRHPKLPVLASEDASDVATRGEYITNPKRNTVSSFDGDVPWKKSPEGWWKFYATREWAVGGFAWTGFDYRGEPSPYGWPSINSQFGIVDMCGFPKDYFFYYKAWWRKEPSLHLFPHWNWHGREGDEIPVWVYSNLDEVELVVNGKSAGTQKVPHLGHVEWTVNYEPGTIEAFGMKDGKIVLTEKRETTGQTVSMRITSDRAEINADGEDVAVIKVEALDNEGRVVPTADNLIAFRVSGPGRLIGVGNGDPNCQESDKEPRRTLFNGLAQAIIQSTKTPGSILVEVAYGGHGTFETLAKASFSSKLAKTRCFVPSIKLSQL